MRTFLVCVAFAAIVPAFDAVAQTTVTESEVLAQLTVENARVQAARASVDIARAEVLAAARWPNPRVTFNREAVASVTENMLTVSQTLPITGRRRLDVGAATARMEANGHRVDDRIRRLRGEHGPPSRAR